jgi:CheY-like chemotaxis protein
MMPLTQVVPQTIEPGVRLLLADDSKDTIDLLMFKTGTLGWTATPVSSASAILQAMNESNEWYDAIVADINFFDNQSGPRISGITAIREIRKVLPDIPVIFITAFINSITKEEVKRVNAELVPKPFDIDKLYEKINDMIRWHRATRQGPREGPDRRLQSINTGDDYRRVTDRQIKPSERVMQVLAELREQSTK